MRQTLLAATAVAGRALPLAIAGPATAPGDHQSTRLAGGILRPVPTNHVGGSPLPRLAEERIALSADARSRYVLLSAGSVREYGTQALRVDIGGGALDEITDVSEAVERISEPAVRTYQELVRRGHCYTDADVIRTRGRVTQARTILGA